MPICDEHPIFRYRMIDYVGGTYLFGAGIGSVFQLMKGISDWSVRGHLDVADVARAVKTNVPCLSSSGAAFAGLFCVVESAVSRARGRDDNEWDTIAAGAVSLGLWRAPRGAVAAARSGLLGATVFGGMGAFILCLDRHIAGVCAPKYRPLRAPVAIITEDEKGGLEGRQTLLYG